MDLFWIIIIALWVIIVALFIATWLHTRADTRRITKQVRYKALFESWKTREWERQFSWRPVQTIDKGTVWLRYYWRRQIYTPASVDGLFTESYHYQNVIQIAWYAK